MSLGVIINHLSVRPSPPGAHLLCPAAYLASLGPLSNLPSAVITFVESAGKEKKESKERNLKFFKSLLEVPNNVHSELELNEMSSFKKSTRKMKDKC